jgi:NlpC/P60 family putative phage cell wall peptidase
MTPSPAAASASSTAARAVAAARAAIGTPFLHQGRRPGVGLDCLGLVLHVERALHGRAPDPPAYAPGWASCSGAETLAEGLSRWCEPLPAPLPGEAPPPGAILLFRWRRQLPASHCAVATPGGFVHAPSGGFVCEVALCPAFARRLAGVFAFRDPLR